MVCLYILLSIDDFIWDVVSLVRRAFYKKKPLDLHLLDSVPPKLLAVVIAAWHEDNVIEDVIDNFIASAIYPKSMYHVFIGVYPNDEATCGAADAIAGRYANVHVIMNDRPGPTSKAQNINHVVRQIKAFERARKWRFASITIHDSEEVVHPYELLVTNYLLNTHKALQFPVIPLIQKPGFKNFFKNITTGTYADEFAENHFTAMVNRDDAGVFVPSAGTGFVISMDVIDIFGEEDLMLESCLTEDYLLSLVLYRKGVRMHYVLEKAPRVTDDDKIAWDFISTRSIFPNSFMAAVRQKTRWILGITMQSFMLRDIFREKFKFIVRYTMYRDYKAKIGNLLAFMGYPMLIYFLVSLFTPLPAVYRLFSLAWYFSLFITLLMVMRQVYRGFANFNVYGMRSVFFSCLFPPLLPIKLIWGNIINFVATLRAYKQNFFGSRPKGGNVEETEGAAHKKKQIAWAKTDHTFLSREVLLRYHRKLGDILLEKGYVTISQLRSALNETAKEKQFIGNYLMQKKMITERELLTALSKIKHIEYFEMLDMDDYNLRQFADAFDRGLLNELVVAPILKTEDGFVVAFCDNSPMYAQTILRSRYGIAVHAVFTSRQNIGRALETMYESKAGGAPAKSRVMDLFEGGVINYEQVIIAYNHINSSKADECDVLRHMGLLRDEG